MANIFNTAVSGLVAFQRALAVTGDNVANAQTPGYSRQTVNLSAIPPDAAAGLLIGNGVNVTSINRQIDQFAIDQLRSGNGLLGQQTAFLTAANQVDNLIGSSTNGISSAITSFFNAFQTLASDPTSASSRQLVLTRAQGLASAIDQAGSQLSALTANNNAQVKATVSSINSIAANIAALNQTIAVQTARAGGAAPNDLLDQRDQLLNQLSSLTTVHTNTESDGSVDIFVGNGQALVVRNQATPLSTAVNAYDPTRLDITYGSGAGQQVLTSQLTGGQLGGLLQVQSQLIVPTRNALGQIATGLAVAVNSQQALGLNQYGTIGQPIFAVAGPAALAAATNAGTATIAISPISSANVGQLTTNDYLLRYAGGAWSATVAGSGQAVAVSGAGTVASPLLIDGLALVVSGAPASGDSFLVQPTAAAASGLNVSLSDPRGVAAAGLLQSTAALANASNASIGAPVVLAAGDPSLSMAATINFLSATTYTVTTTTPGGPVTSGVLNLGANGVITAPAVAGVPGSGGGWSVTLTGTPASLDSYTVGPNTSGTGDNRNALAMAGLQNQGTLAGGTVGLSAAYATLVGVVGTQTQQATAAQSAQQAVVSQVQQQVSSVSGVNLDEEAAQLLQWQQAYAAAAKVVTTADTIFNTLLNAIR
jgi:flagellar hook-associated protein 1 FlgK